MPDDVLFAGPGNAVVLQFEPWRFGSEPKIDDFLRATALFQGVGVSASGIFDFFARDIATFAKAAEKAFSTLKGQASLSSDNSRFVLSVSFTNGGEVVVDGQWAPGDPRRRVDSHRVRG